MGRNKIKFEYIEDDRARSITFNKRKKGLLNKAAEIALLCKIKLVLTFTDLYGNVYNLVAPDESAINEIKLNHQVKNTYKVNLSDYPHFKIKDIETESSGESLEENDKKQLEENFQNEIQKIREEKKSLNKKNQKKQIKFHQKNSKQNKNPGDSQNIKDNQCKQEVKQEEQDLVKPPQIFLENDTPTRKKKHPDLEKNNKMSNSNHPQQETIYQPCYFIPFQAPHQFQPNYHYPFLQNPIQKQINQLFDSNKYQNYLDEIKKE